MFGDNVTNCEVVADSCQFSVTRRSTGCCEACRGHVQAVGASSSTLGRRPALFLRRRRQYGVVLQPTTHREFRQRRRRVVQVSSSAPLSQMMFYAKFFMAGWRRIFEGT